ncbi:hypothetical protein DTB58_11495, partial [Streptomyces griseus]|uniref:alpha/beta hydrolase n=1 Tax=Streptomyces griseus TaxID=1911 RepID=UPI001C568EF7
MPDRPRGARRFRALLAELVTFAVAVPVSGAARPAAVPAPAPSVHGPLRDADPTALARRYAVSRQDIRAAERAAAEHGDLRRAASLREMAEPGRRFLAFDGRDGGRSTEVVGDLSAARRVAVLVPGARVGLAAYWRLRPDARALHREFGADAAVAAWLGYRPPAALGPAPLPAPRADAAAPAPRPPVGGGRGLAPTARVSRPVH